MKRKPLSTTSAPRYPRRRAYLASFHRVLRRSAAGFGTALLLLSSQVSAEGEAPEQVVQRTVTGAADSEGDESNVENPEQRWMIWLEDVGFCPTMDCEPEPTQVRTAGVRLAGVTVAGSLSREAVRRHIRLQRNQYRRCYEQQLITAPELEGRVTVRFVVGGDGVVLAAVVAESTLGSSSVESCVVDVVREIRFPRPEWGGTFVVTYPFLFRPTPMTRAPAGTHTPASYPASG